MSSTAALRILVVGGNGFIGSAVCKAAVSRGIQVTSVSSSGNSYRTAKGHSPAWTSKVFIDSLTPVSLHMSNLQTILAFCLQVIWEKGDALRPSTFDHILSHVDGVVHTLGTLMEDTRYKRALKEGNLPALFGSIAHSLLGDRGNPLKQSISSSFHENDVTYDSLNRDTALRVCDAFLNSAPTKQHGTDESALRKPRPFVYISAEDIFRPVIPARYVETKREAEREIEQMIQARSDQYRGVYIRPSLVYHAHYRPLTTPAAVLFDLSSTIHRKIPRSIPTPADIFRSLGGVATSPANSRNGMPSSLESIANALTIPPIHVDHVADAIIATLEDTQVEGVVDVARMRELIGWKDEADRSLSNASAKRDFGLS